MFQVDGSMARLDTYEFYVNGKHKGECFYAFRKDTGKSFI
jgi:hypothetical protein